MEMKKNYITNMAPLLENIEACLEHIFVINFNRSLTVSSEIPIDLCIIIFVWLSQVF
jgi:hypothetical protein